MAAFNTKCPHCQGDLEVQTEWIDMELECPLCSSSFILQQSIEPPTEKQCPLCGNMIKYQATRCKFCKQQISPLPHTNPQQSPDAAGKQKHKFCTKKIIIIISISAVILAIILLTLGATYYGVNENAKKTLRMAKFIMEPDYDLSEEECQREIENITAFYNRNAKFLSKENRNNLQGMISKLEIRKKEFAKIPSRQAVAQLRFDNSTYKTNILIRKKINLKNTCSLFIFPEERKAHVQMIYGKIEQIGKSVNQMKYHMEESKKCRERADKVNISGIASYNQNSDLLDQALEHTKKARNAILQAKKYHDEVKNLLLQETLSGMQQMMNKEKDIMVWNIKNNSCDVTNVRGPIILLALETINWGYDFESFQAWYLEYNPFSVKTWELK